MSFSPSSMVRSWNRFLALSSSACTVVFWVLNSLMTLVPSAYDLVAMSCASFTWSRCVATAERTPTARVPLSCISSNIGAISAKPPFDFIACMNFIKPSLALVFIRLENSLTCMPAILANLAGSWYILVMSCEKTVAEVASSCMFWSRAEARPISCAWVMPAWMPTPERSAVKSTM